MCKGTLLALGALLGTIGLMFGTTSDARSQKPPGEETLQQRLARTTKLSDDDIAKVWKELGPAIKEEISRGHEVTIPGLGMIRIVRIPEHKDLRDGRPVTIAATNSVEFLGTAELTAAANVRGVQPSGTVPDFRFNVFPNQNPAPSQRVPSSRIPSPP